MRPGDLLYSLCVRGLTTADEGVYYRGSMELKLS